MLCHFRIFRMWLWEIFHLFRRNLYNFNVVEQKLFNCEFENFWFLLQIDMLYEFIGMQTSSEDCWLHVYIRYTASMCIRMWKPGNRPKKSSLMTSRPFAQDCWKIFYEVKLEFKCSFGLVLHDETKIQTWNGLFLLYFGLLFYAKSIAFALRMWIFRIFIFSVFDHCNCFNFLT